MKRILLGTAALMALGTAHAAAQESVKIGFVSTFSGPTAVIGNDMRNSFELALDHLGRKMGGKPVEVIYEDDQQKPEVGVQKSRKLVESDRVNFVIGYIWSNVLLASLKPVVDSQTFLISSNAGPHQIAGEDVEVIRSRTNDLMQASMKLGEAMYQASQAAEGQAGESAQQGPKDDVIDADFQEVDDDEKKKRA